ncbi:hypothetical protein AJ79_02315 [Helicocarpus griseus UAMH5409]|uniref:Cytochrome P450 52A11 n=1 Tax=Helicocarpus griseus UAMH5409 TaxID=1447875 RepID=A0A2B7Y3D2_9EURO|nr:hypothetical protein AJ79_02315 [Helicocarpus griseus UAMH5409]
MLSKLISQFSISLWWPWLLLGVVAPLIVKRAMRNASKEAKIRQCGGHAPQYRGWLPFGLSFIVDFRSAVSSDDCLKFCSNTFVRLCRGRKNPYTVEATVAGQRIIVTADPENIKAILATQFWEFEKGAKFRRDWVDMLGHSIFNSDGQAWHDARARLRPVFSRERISDLECFERHVQDLLPLLGTEGETVDMKDLSLRFTLDASADFTLGANLETLKKPENEFGACFERSRHFKVQRERSAPFKFLVPKSRYLPYIQYIEFFMDPIIQETMEQVKAEAAGQRPSKKQRGYTLLHACAEISTDQRFLRDELITALFAGRDNTAMALTWTLYELARHPDVVDELRRVIETTIGFEHQPTYDDLKGMKILSNMVSETLRLYPGVPLNTRACVKDTSLPRGGGPDGDGPIGVPAGTGIIISYHMLQLNSSLYPPASDSFPPANEWHPGRWDTWFPQPWSYIPFHGGPRFCLGQQLAIMEISYVLVRIFQQYSGVELRMKETGLVEKHGSKWERREEREPELAERFMEKRPRMAAEIMLYPRGGVRLGFLK